jgi:hypothetical protein
MKKSALYLLLITFLINSYPSLAQDDGHLSKKDLQKKNDEIQSVLDRLDQRLDTMKTKVESSAPEIMPDISLDIEKNNPPSAVPDINTEVKKESAPPAMLAISPDIKFVTKKLTEDYSGPISFLAKKSSLWVKDSMLAEGKGINDLIKVVISGELYAPYKPIKDITESEINRTTIEGAVNSAFSANKNADIEWIVANFVEEEQSKARFFFKDKNILNDSKKDAENIKLKHITGKLPFKGYEIVLVEQDYGDNKKVTEVITFKKEKDEYKITNILTDDETYDLMFAAVSNGDVIPQ